MKVTLVILFGTKTDTAWATCKKRLGELNPSFIKRMQVYKGEDISDAKLRFMEKFTHRGDMDIKKVFTKSEAAGKIWTWVLAMEKYAKCYRDVRPKEMKLKVLNDQLNQKRKMLDTYK